MTAITMTLNLSEREMAAVDKLAASHNLSKTGVLRQALKLYVLVNDELATNGGQFCLSGKPVILAAVGLGDAPTEPLKRKSK